MNLQDQFAWARNLRNKKSTAVYLVPKQEPQVRRSELLIPTTVGSSRALVYEPIESPEILRPVFINLHGGGFVKGKAENDDNWCAFIAEKAGCVVLNIDYRLAPEHKFPIAILEVYEVAKWLYINGKEMNLDSQKIAIGGHSAGGNLATAVCLLNKEQENKIPFVYQILDYPPLDLDTSPELKPQFEQSIPIEFAKNFNYCYLNHNEERKNPLASPVLATSLEELPPTLVITAEYDSLAKEAQIYAEKLREAGNSVIYKEFKGVDHNFNFTGKDFEKAEASWRLMVNELKKAFI